MDFATKYAKILVLSYMQDACVGKWLNLLNLEYLQLQNRDNKSTYLMLCGLHKIQA